MRFDPKTLLIILVLPFLSGAAALAHELLWTRRLVDLLGATDWVTGRVLGLFFLGISLGGYLATFQTRSKLPPIYLLLIAEFCIGILALPAAFLPFWTDWIWTVLGTESLVSWQGAAIKLLLAIMVVMPPSIAMGFTLPFFVRTATDLGAQVGSIGILIYVLNTLGGVFGSWFASTHLMQWAGAQGAMLLTIGINFLVAGTLCFFRKPQQTRQAIKKRRKSKSKRQKESVNQLPRGDGASEEEFSRMSLLALSFVSGFVVLSLEVLLLRLISLVVPSSYHTTSALLANVILFLAIGSGLVSLANFFRSTRGLTRRRHLLIAAFSGAAIFISFCPILLYQCTDKLLSVRYLLGLNGQTIDSINQYWGLVFWLVASTGGLALLFSGLVFPSLLTMSSQEDEKGEKIGLLLAANGVGGLAGAELFNSVVIGSVGIYQGFTLLAGLIGVVVFALTFKPKVVTGFGVTAGLLGIVWIGQSYSGDLPYLSPRTKSNFEIIGTHFGREGAWLIVEPPSEKSKSILVNNQYMLGGSGAAIKQRRQLLFAWVLNPEAKSACCLGLATGISASGLEEVENAPPVTAVELSETVYRLARKHFAKETNGFFDREENRVVLEDARIYMAAASNQFDLISGDLYRPQGPGEGRLFSIEHFRNVKKALTDEGLFCQWLPLYQLNETNWRTIAATFQAVFPETLVVYGNVDPRYPVMGLIGTKNDQKWDPGDLQSRFSQITDETLRIDPLLASAPGLVVGVLDKDVLSGEPINTLDNLKIEISAGDFWILKDLRRNRKSVYEREFLFGNSLLEFNRRLDTFTQPVFPRNYFEQLKAKFKSQISRQN